MQSHTQITFCLKSFTHSVIQSTCSYINIQTGECRVVKYKHQEPAYVQQIKILGNDSGTTELQKVCIVLRMPVSWVIHCIYWLFFRWFDWPVKHIRSGDQLQYGYTMKTFLAIWKMLHSRCGAGDRHFTYTHQKSVGSSWCRSESKRQTADPELKRTDSRRGSVRSQDVKV